jgi:hypothetical protein
MGVTIYGDQSGDNYHAAQELKPALEGLLQFPENEARVVASAFTPGCAVQDTDLLVLGILRRPVDVPRNLLPEPLRVRPRKISNFALAIELKSHPSDAVRFEGNQVLVRYRTRLIRHLLKVATSADSDDVVVDFFAGSGPTGHAVLAQNAEDSGKRRFVLVQLPEPLPQPEVRSKTIADLATSRLRTPVNNRLANLRTQIAFATEGDDTALADHGIPSIDSTTRLAQKQFNRWLDLEEADRLWTCSLDDLIDVYVVHCGACTEKGLVPWRRTSDRYDHIRCPAHEPRAD